LKDFEAHTRYRIDFDTIDLNFFYKFITYLKSSRESSGRIKKKNPLSQNSIAKTIQVLITVMNEAVEQNLTTNLQFKSKKFCVSWEETDSVYLSENEISKLFQKDLSNKKRLEQVRDLFVFGCSVGLRYSDYSEVKPENIIVVEGEKFIKMRTRKTGEMVVIPCSPEVLQIFEKYAANKNSLPPTISNQKFNEYIKQACREAELTEKGRLLSEPDKELCESVSSHTARRSFATNLYLSGFPAIELMKITGHRTEKAFLTYIKVSQLDTAKRLSKHMQLRWSEKILKAV
jgi:integrase